MSYRNDARTQDQILDGMPYFEIGGELTLSVRFKLNDASQGIQTLIAKNLGQGEERWALSHYGPNRMWFHHKSTTTHYYNYGTPGLIQSNTWYHACGVKRAGVLYLYHNGALDTSIAGGEGIADGPPGLGLIGGDDNSRYFAGHAGEFAIWNRGLMPNEVASLASGTPPWVYSNGLQGYWPAMGGVDVQPVADLSGTGKHAYKYNASGYPAPSGFHCMTTRPGLR